MVNKNEEKNKGKKNQTKKQRILKLNLVSTMGGPAGC